MEVRREHDRHHPVDGEQGAKAMAVRRWVDLDPERLSYEMTLTATDTIPADRLEGMMGFAAEK